MNDGPYDETNRPILGKELGTDEGTTTRNRFFAVIDRTNLTLELSANGATGKQAAPPVFFDYQPNVPLANGVGPSGYNVIPDPDLFPANQPPGPPKPAGLSSVACRIPASSQVLGSPTKTVQASGYYDGTPWTIADHSPSHTTPI